MDRSSLCSSRDLHLIVPADVLGPVVGQPTTGHGLLRVVTTDRANGMGETITFRSTRDGGKKNRELCRPWQREAGRRMGETDINNDV